MNAHIKVGIGLESSQSAALNFVAVTQVFQMAIEQKMNAPMCGLLAGKALHFHSVLLLL